MVFVKQMLCSKGNRRSIQAHLLRPALRRTVSSPTSLVYSLAFVLALLQILIDDFLFSPSMREYCVGRDFAAGRFAKDDLAEGYGYHVHLLKLFNIEFEVTWIADYDREATINALESARREATTSAYCQRAAMICYRSLSEKAAPSEGEASLKFKSRQGYPKPRC